MLSRNVSVKVEQTLGGLERCVTHTLSLRKSPKSSVSHTLCVLRKVCHTLCVLRKVLLPCVSQNKYVTHCVSHFAVISQLSWLHVTMQAPQTTSFLALRMWGQGVRAEGAPPTYLYYVLSLRVCVTGDLVAPFLTVKIQQTMCDVSPSPPCVNCVTIPLHI